MDQPQAEEPFTTRVLVKEWRFHEKTLLVILYIAILITNCNCQTLMNESRSLTKSDLNLATNIDPKHCHSCRTSSDKIKKPENVNSNIYEDMIECVYLITEEYLYKTNKTELKSRLEMIVDSILSKDRYEIIDGIEIKTVETKKLNETAESRGLFDSYTFEYRLFKKIRDFVDTHALSINLPKAARFIGFRSFGLKKFFLPIFIGAQVFKSILLAMFLPSILGSFGKILGKGISQISAASSQASYPPAQTAEQDAYNNDQNGMMAYDDPGYAYPQDANSLYANMDSEVNDVGNVDLSRFGAGTQKVSYLPSKNSYDKQQMQAQATNNYKVFQKIPASSMILSNYDPFYSPLLSRLDGIFARLGLAPSENEIDTTQVGGQPAHDAKLEACREQLICLMYSSPAKYAPYSNLVSAQLSRELNDLRRPVSDNPEILRFFRYMRAARRGQEGVDCARAHPACAAHAAPQHTMIAAYHDINKLLTARKLTRKW